MAISKEVLDQLLSDRDASDVFAKDGLLDELKKALSERILNAELDEHLVSENVEEAGNRRNGTSRKTVLTGTSKVALDIPRDRSGTFDPKLIAKYQRRFPEFDDKIVSMYARGMTVREIRGHLEDLYGIDVSPDLISTVTDAVLEEVGEWQNRPLDACYPLVFFDAIRVKIRDEGFVRNKAVYIALGILPDGTKEILGLWVEQTEGAKFWLRVMNEIRNRGVQDILIAVVDGLKGFPDAINATFPETVVQTCIVHLIRQSLSFASWKDRKHVARELKSVYRATDAEAGLAALDAFEAGQWGEKYPSIGQSWRRAWQHVIPFFAFPEAVRRIVYTTNAIESLNAKLRRAIKARGHFPSDDAAIKLLYLVLNKAAGEWKRPPREWTEAKTQFAVIFGERFVVQQ
ncbi:MAG: IS256 family transposase [Alphaproteobacteria bacterium]